MNAEEYRRGDQIQQNMEFLLKPDKAKMLRNDLGAGEVLLHRFLESASAFLDWDVGLPEQQDFRTEQMRNILKEEPVRSLQSFDDIDLEWREWTTYVKAFEEKLWALEAQQFKPYHE